MGEGPVAKRRFKRRTIRNAVIGGVIVIIISLAGGFGWKMYNKMSVEAAKAAVEARDDQARKIAGSIQSRYIDLSQPLMALAKDETTISLFEAGDKAALAAAAEQNQSSIPFALKLRYLLPGDYELDQASNPPLSYASLDLLGKAERTNQTNAEVLLFGSEQQHVVVIERVVNQALELVGLLHLSLSVDVFAELVAELNLGPEYVELTQRIGGKVQTLAKAGDAGYRQGEAITVSVNDTRWIVAYWTADAPAATAASTTEGSGLPLVPIAVVVLLLILGSLFFLKKRASGSASSADGGPAVTYEGAVRAIVEGAHAGVQKWIPNLPKADRITGNVKPISKGMTGDDVTMIATPPKEPQQPAAKADAAAKDNAKPAAAPAAKKPKQAPPAPKPAAEAEPKTDAAPAAKPEATSSASIDPVIFRTYDIRGVVGKTLTEEAVLEIAKAIGTMAGERGQQKIVVGRDGRNTSPALAEAVIGGLRHTGRNVIDIGMVPTPVLYFATYHLETKSGVMITGSHNPSEYNGLKMMLAGNTLSGEDIQQLRKLTEAGEYSSGHGELSNADVNADYIRRIADDIPVALGNSLKIVVDCGNGVAGVLAPQLLNAIGHDVVEMYCDIDGSFPNHHPDPSQPENLQELIDRVKAENADVGFAFDGDGDRLGIVDAEGNIIWPDRQMMLLAKDVLSRNQGAQIIYDVKCSRHLKTVIEENGGQPLMWKTGHSLIKGKMREVEAPLAGEMSGHIFFKERWYGFDDALYTAARFIEIFTNAKRSPTELFAELPEGVSTPELRMPLPESEHGSFMAAMIQLMEDAGGEVSDIDGVRVEYEDGWGLARPSNTSPNIILRFEGENEDALERIKSVFKKAVQSVKADAELPF